MADQDMMKELNNTNAGPPGKPVAFDPEEFMHFLNDVDWPDDKKAEYTVLVWEIVCEFVALGFDVHPLQQAQNTCGKLAETRDQSPSTAGDMLNSSYTHLIKEFARQNGAQPAPDEKGVIDG